MTALEAPAATGPGAALDRAAVYRLLAELFAAEPDADLLALACTVPELAPHATQADAAGYTHVFVLNAYPYASVYLEPDAAIGGARAGFTRGVLEALGLEVDPGTAADHVAVLLAALAALSEREADDGERLAVERARHAQRTLLAEHLLPWLPHFLDAVQRTDRGLYRAAAALAARRLSEHARSLEGEAGAPVPVAREAAATRQRAEGGPPPRPVAEPGQDAPDPPLTRLTSPARCGFFLCRADIARMASELGLSVRFGGRPFMLESLAQAAVQAGCGERLEDALAGFAAERRATLERWSEALPSVAAPWRDALARSTRTAASWAHGATGGGEAGTA